MVGEHSYRTEVPAVRRDGAVRRENVGMSNHNPNEKLEPRKSKVSVALAINHGLGGPKAIPKGVADGQTVNIPSLPRDYPLRDEGDKTECLIGLASMARSSSERCGDARNLPCELC
jgi:hypothetical protein